MFDPEDAAYGYARRYMSEDLRLFSTLGGEKSKIVGQADILPLVLAGQICGDRMRDRAVYFFINNNAARHCFIKGTPSDPHMSVMLISFWEQGWSPSPWVTRRRGSPHAFYVLKLHPRFSVTR